MKKSAIIALLLAGLVQVDAAPLRVAVLDFEDATGMKSDDRLGGAIAPGALADKGVYAIGKQLVNKEGFVLIDRRDFLAQMDQIRNLDMDAPTPARPSFLQAAQALRADVVLRGTILSLSTSKQLVNQGGYTADNSVMTLRVSVEALDAKDGTVIAVADGASKFTVRQTEALQTVLSEDDVLGMMDSALAKAIPPLEEALQARVEQLQARPTVKLTVKTTSEPAMVEIDGLLIGSTPIENFELYKGDHILSITKPGYQQITKRVLFEKDTLVEAPMLREDLTAEEKKQVLDGAHIDVIDSSMPGLIIKSVE
ncbi:MAG: PEGA domain-containing protein [bacterium]